ncbi:hypothetical protein N0V93_008472 [Gnomoniopsis smithogilvyi]|uniref:Uncharacterized protein n=1 Tax=Gnomoniopsis smithogilvyi TaxID=1191159 RepID=A0A9W8YN21_9PEZI|nr:hypothetical protein N0V93_008472 [Gnomoniopsis smithogilvyi]
MGRWGFRIFQGDADLDTRSDVEESIVTALKSEIFDQILSSDPQMREVANRIIQDATDESVENGGGFYLMGKIESGDPVVREILDSCICDTLFDLAEGEAFTEIIIGVMMMQAGARLRPKHKRRLRQIVACFPEGDTQLPENGFSNAGQAQLSAALDHYEAGIPRDFHTPSCDNCGKINEDIGTELLNCERSAKLPTRRSTLSMDLASTTLNTECVVTRNDFRGISSTKPSIANEEDHGTNDAPMKELKGKKQHQYLNLLAFPWESF